MELIISMNKMNKNKTVKSHCQMKDSVSEITIQSVCSASWTVCPCANKALSM